MLLFVRQNVQIWPSARQLEIDSRTFIGCESAAEVHIIRVSRRVR